MSSHDHTPEKPETAGNAVSTAEEAPPHQKSGYRYYVLGILMFVFGINVLDRQILAILMEPVRLDLGLSDTHLGFLSGIAFAIFYATLGIPIARIADRTSRTAVVSISLAAWSLMTALCGFAQNFWHLLLARIGVAVGEAGGTPPSHSLLADYFSENQRATALGIFSLGGPLGMMVGLFVAGLLNDAYGWRATFMLLGLPGVVLAIVIWVTIREPRKARPKKTTADPPVKEVFKMLWSQRSFRFMALASAIQMFVGYGLVQWYPAFFMRSHGLTTTQVGTYLALMAGISGGLGTLLGGYAADKFAARDKRWLLWLPMWATFLATPFYIGVFLVSNPIVAVCFMVLPTFLMNSFLGPIFSTTQGLVPSYMRATAAAVLLFVTNIIGLGLGPQAVGILSDLLRPMYGENSLRYALLTIAMLTVVGAYFYWVAARTLREDLARAKSMDS
jgi:predicted MFS family arabinose efflux permease